MTEQGVALWERLKLRGERAIERGLRDLAAPEREQLISLLIRVRDALNA